MEHLTGLFRLRLGLLWFRVRQKMSLLKPSSLKAHKFPEAIFKYQILPICSKWASPLFSLILFTFPHHTHTHRFTTVSIVRLPICAMLRGSKSPFPPFSLRINYPRKSHRKAHRLHYSALSMPWSIGSMEVIGIMSSVQGPCRDGLIHLSH